MDREYNEAMDDLRFSPAAKERMAARLAAAQEQARAVRPQPDVHAARGGKRRWRFAAAAAATVVLAVGLAGGAYASGALMGVGNVMDDLFGGPPAQTEVVGKIGRPLGASATSNGVTVNRCPAIASLGGSQQNSEEEYLINKMMRSLGVIAIDNQARV